MEEELKKYDIFVDFGDGDKFHINDITVDEDKKKIILRGKQEQLGWVRLNALHPIKLVGDKQLEEVSTYVDFADEDDTYDEDASSDDDEDDTYDEITENLTISKKCTTFMEDLNQQRKVLIRLSC